MWPEHQHRQNQGRQPPAWSLYGAFRYPQAIPTPQVPTTPAVVPGREPGIQSYDGLEKKLKEVFSERSSILHQLSKTSKELDSIKGNLQILAGSLRCLLLLLS
ncbi:hypothetical protein CRENBAI_000266 [Crenichthys baileyi]|uniref:Uncharacterized protein n=1 Tax=Crenichthys baileyi TaxID=28760 RepID=A0AAV9S2T8_9TELE